MDSSENVRAFEEVQIPVPWGHISGKWWEPCDRRPIVCFHGWQDNCGTFDRLIPLLPRDVGFLTVDAPGHGLSSRYPPGQIYDSMQLPILIRRIMKHFQWAKISLMGHSMGGIATFMFAALFPDSVDFVICLEGFNPITRPPGRAIKRSARTIDMFLKYDSLTANGAEPPVYTYNEMIDKFHSASGMSVDKENCSYLLKRNIRASSIHSGKFYFTRDPRLKSFHVVPVQHSDSVALAKQFTCPVLVVAATLSQFRGKGSMTEILEYIKQSSKDCRYVCLEGSHHAHLNSPKGFVDIISDFLKANDVEDRTGGTIDCLKKSKL